MASRRSPAPSVLKVRKNRPMQPQAKGVSMPFLIGLFQGATFKVVQGAATVFFSLVGSFLASNLVQFFRDAVTEALEYLVEQREQKAKETPGKDDDRRAAIYRKWLEKFKLHEDKKAGE